MEANDTSLAGHGGAAKTLRECEEFMREVFVYKPVLRRWLSHKYKRDSSRVGDDIIQESMLRAFLVWSSGKTIDDMELFLFIAAKRISIDIWRKENIIPTVPFAQHEFAEGDTEELSIFASWDTDPAQAIEYEQEYAHHRMILRLRKNQMGKRMRQVFELKATGFSQREIAAKLEISENTVEQHLGHAYKLVRGNRPNAPPLTALFTHP